MSREHYGKVLRDTARAGVYHTPPQGMADLVAAAESAGYAVYRVDLGGAKDKDALLERLALSLEFPDWFGHNWDALQDCLTDLSWQPAEGHIVILERCDGFRADHGEDFATALQVFAAASDYWREEGVPFWTLVDMHADGIAYLPGL
jgi:RNAse (barnase) inhibitor barstar